MNVIIRQYQQSDLEGVLNSWEVATRLVHEFMTDEFIAEQRINVEKVYLPNTDTWVAEINGTVQGFISLMGNEVGAIFLQPQYHGMGVGKALMDLQSKSNWPHILFKLWISSYKGNSA